jgi:hypothetical protein
MWKPLAEVSHTSLSPAEEAGYSTYVEILHSGRSL